MAPLIVCKQVVKAYKVDDHELVALRGIDFEMEKGEMVSIIGPSGAGKSSLLNLLGGLDTPTAGQLTVAAGRRAVSPEQAEITRLRAELSRARMEVSILKKAAAYFAREQR